MFILYCFVVFVFVVSLFSFSVSVFFPLFFCCHCFCLPCNSIIISIFCFCLCNYVCTVDGERFAGLNIHGFSTIKVFMEIFSHCLGHKYSLFSIIKARYLYSWKNFRSTPKNREKCESLAQRIFSRFRYSLMICMCPCLRFNNNNNKFGR